MSERAGSGGGQEGSTQVAYYENPGILMIVQTIEDGKGNLDKKVLTHAMCCYISRVVPVPVATSSV
jgi:hypothetical protein